MKRKKSKGECTSSSNINESGEIIENESENENQNHWSRRFSNPFHGGLEWMESIKRNSKDDSLSDSQFKRVSP